MYFEETDWCYRAHAGGPGRLVLRRDRDHPPGRAGRRHRPAISACASSRRATACSWPSTTAAGRSGSFRLAQFAEYGLKSLLRRLAPGDRAQNRALADTFAYRAKLQLKNPHRSHSPGLT